MSPRISRCNRSRPSPSRAPDQEPATLCAVAKVRKPKKATAKPKKRSAARAEWSLDDAIAEARAHVKDKRIDSAVEVLRDARGRVRRASTRETLRAGADTLASRQMWNQQFEAAVALFDEAIAAYRDGDDTERLARMANDRGYCLHQAGRLDDAEASCRLGAQLHGAAGWGREQPVQPVGHRVRARQDR